MGGDAFTIQKDFHHCSSEPHIHLFLDVIVRNAVKHLVHANVIIVGCCADLPLGKLIIKPPKKSIKAFVAALSETILGRGKAWKQEVLIEKLNQKIRGWANYHPSVCASNAFASIDHNLYLLLWRWAKHRHPHKGNWWVPDKYWHRKGTRKWVFCTESKELLLVDHIPIVRHTRVRTDAKPYLEPEYFIQRQFNHGMKML